VNPDPWTTFVNDFLDKYEPVPAQRETFMAALRLEPRYKAARYIFSTGGVRAATIQLHTAMEDAMHHMIREGKDHA